ncbi:MAG: SUMF1/EgtB/PvdO family nonheme iron enzyme [Acidobacteria bacterium]|nr:SUMF1/EgtB/PvdO family nonheme iron enzyme [Acidobacteriota bacterium]
MKGSLWRWVVVWVSLSAALPAVAQPPSGALAIDERQGDQWGWAVDYETVAAARERALRECGSGCSVVLTFERCAAYAADQAAASTAYGWAEDHASGEAARGRALSECRSLGGGSGCVVRAWGCNGPVVEEQLGLDYSARRRIQQGLVSEGLDPGTPDGLFGPRTRAAIRRWQTSRGAPSTGYLDGASAEALESAAGGGSASAAVEPLAAPGALGESQAASPAASAELEGLFWQSVMNSTNPAEFEAYLRRFPNGVFSELARARLAALRSGSSAAPAGARPRVGGAGAPASGSGVVGSRVSGAAAPAFGPVTGGDVARRPGEVFRDCAACPEMVVLPGGDLAMGRYEVTVGEYRAFASATSGGAGGGCFFLDRLSWRDPGFPQTERHPVTCVSWDDAQAYLSWLSRTIGMTYRLPTESEWAQAAAGSQPGCERARTGRDETCPVGSYGSNSAGLSDMVGNLWEWTNDCWNGDCDERFVRGASWLNTAGLQHPITRLPFSTGRRDRTFGFRVLRTLD